MTKYWAIILSTILFACGDSNTIPKPKGYPRIVLPEASYVKIDLDCPFDFEINQSSQLMSSQNPEQPCWINIDYPSLKCRIHFSYKPVDGNLGQLLEDSRTLVYKHTIKASAINETETLDTLNKVYGRIYELEGDAASSVQFFATDSVDHFLRGALYFNARTNADSLKPAIEFIRKDVEHIMSTLRWSSIQE